jgi:stage II sporulation protein D
VPQAAIAVRDTHGLIRLWDTPDGERLLSTYFSSTCGGETLTFDPNDRQAASLSLPPTRQCEHCQQSPHYRWGPVTLTKSFITQQLRQRYEKFNEIGVIDHIDVGQATEGGRLVQLALCDDAEQCIPLEAENFRLAVDSTGRTLRSTFVTMIDEESSITFANGRGFGHGIGMCQYGAETLARDGRTAEEILQYYYPTSRSASAY